MSPKIGGFTTKWETISIKPPKGTPSVYSRHLFWEGWRCWSHVQEGHEYTFESGGGRGIHRHRAGATANAERVNYLHYFISKFD